MISTAIRITAPTVLPVSLAEFKAHARITHSEDDALIIGYIKSAVEEVENFTGLGLITQVWQQSWTDFTTEQMTLWRRPVQSISAFGYYDSNNVLQPFSTTDYVVANVGSDRFSSVLTLAYGVTAPTLYSTSEAIVATYTVGFGDDWNSVPELIRSEVMQLALDKYDYRGNLMGQAVNVLQQGSQSRLQHWRPIAVA